MELMGSTQAAKQGRGFLTAHLMRTENHFQLLQEPIGQFVSSQRGQKLPDCLMGLSSNMPGPTQQYCNKGTVILPENGEISRLSNGGSSANHLATKAQSIQHFVQSPRPTLSCINIQGQTQISNSTLRTELYFQGAAVHDPRGDALSAAVQYTLLWEKTNI